jgi:hypothetical protein
MTPSSQTQREDMHESQSKPKKKSQRRSLPSKQKHRPKKGEKKPNRNLPPGPGLPSRGLRPTTSWVGDNAHARCPPRHHTPSQSTMAPPGDHHPLVARSWQHIGLPLVAVLQRYVGGWFRGRPRTKRQSDPSQCYSAAIFLDGSPRRGP